jgi:hypothetical protein
MMAAIVREAREELGLDISGHEAQLGALGLIEVDTEREIGTHVLVATALLPGPADNFQPNHAAIDPVEGAWEIGDTALTINIRAATQTATAARTFVAWLRSAPDLVPHAAGALLLLVIARQQLHERQSDRAQAAGLHHGSPTWTTTDLALWLHEPPPTEAPDVTAFVRRRPLAK